MKIAATEPGPGADAHAPGAVAGKAVLTLAGREAIERSHALAAIADELRTPLNVVIGFAQLLAAPGVAPLTARQRRYVARIEESARHVLSLINDVVDPARGDGYVLGEDRPPELRLLRPAAPRRSAEAGR